MNRNLGLFADCNIAPVIESISWNGIDSDNILKIGIDGYHWFPNTIKIISSAQKKQIGDRIQEKTVKIFTNFVNVDFIKSLLSSLWPAKTGWITGATTPVILEIGKIISR